MEAPKTVVDAMHRSTTTRPPVAWVQAPLSYLVPGPGRPRSYAYPPPVGEPWESAAFDPVEVLITDGRRSAAASSLDDQGFELWDAPTRVNDFDDPEHIRSVYYPECAELALAATGAQRAYIFDHLVRRREAGRPSLTFGRASAGRAAANGRIHNDYTEQSGVRRLAIVLPQASDRANIRRYAIVNIWRSIRGPVVDTPLAVCDARSVCPGELVKAEVLYPNRSGEIYFVTQSAEHRWTYFSEMDRHEALVFKQFDSDHRVARFTPHAAFDHPGAPRDAPLRESIEARCLVVYE